MTIADMRALLRLVGELHELPPDRDGRVVHALTRLSELVKAPVCSMQEVNGFQRGQPAFPTVWARAIGPPEACGLFERFAHEADNSGPSVAHLARHPGRVILRTEVMSDREWFATEEFNEFVRPAGIDMGMAGSFLLPRAGGVIGISCNRELRDRRLGARERTILQYFQDHFGWFFRSISARTEPECLQGMPRHLRRTLSRLLAGDSEKQAAAHLGLSRHTVHEYVKSLYRRFEVMSRSELLIKVLRLGVNDSMLSESDAGGTD